MRVRRQTVEHPCGTIKFWTGDRHFQMKTLKHVITEMARHVLAYTMCPGHCLQQQHHLRFIQTILSV